MILWTAKFDNFSWILRTNLANLDCNGIFKRYSAEIVNFCQFKKKQAVHNVSGSGAQCDFVRNNSNCQDYEGYINYIEVLYCQFQGQVGLGLVLFFIWIAYIFVALGKSADNYLCPNLAVISKTLRMSQNLAGITILAFGNGAPDIFSSIAGIGNDRPELVFGELFGAGLFVTTVVAGSISILKPFGLARRPFVRDAGFYMIGGFWAFFIFYR